MSHDEGNNELVKFRSVVLGSVQRVFDEGRHGEDLMPVAFILSRALLPQARCLSGQEREMRIVPIDRYFSSDTGKNKLMVDLGRIAGFPACLGIAIVSEIWVAKVARLEDVGTTPISQRGDRTEAVMVRVEVRGSEVEVWIAPISVNPDGTRALAEFKSMPSEGGRMAEALFPENRPKVAHAHHVC